MLENIKNFNVGDFVMVGFVQNDFLQESLKSCMLVVLVHFKS